MSTDDFDQKLTSDLNEYKYDIMSNRNVNDILQTHPHIKAKFETERAKYRIINKLNEYDNRIGTCVIQKRNWLGNWKETTGWKRVDGVDGDDILSKKKFDWNRDTEISIHLEFAEQFLTEYIFHDLGIPYKQSKWTFRW